MSLITVYMLVVFTVISRKKLGEHLVVIFNFVQKEVVVKGHPVNGCHSMLVVYGRKLSIWEG